MYLRTGPAATRQHGFGILLRWSCFYSGTGWLCHAIAHNLGGLYGVPHGKANAIVLPYILEFSREACQERLARLAVVAKLGDSSEPKNELSLRFIEKIKAMNADMDIPSKVDELKEADIALIARRALREGNPGYPVPALMNQRDCENILMRLLP